MTTNATPVGKTKRPHSVRVRVSDPELEYLRAEALRTDRSVGAILRVALREYLERRQGQS